MSTKFNRKAHYRTNYATGTRYYVSEHEVVKQYYSTKNENGRNIVNGQYVIKETYCRSCKSLVFYISLSDKSNILFDNSSNPLKRHNCARVAKNNIEKGELRKSKKFMSDTEIAAQRAREEIERNQKKHLYKNKEADLQKISRKRMELLSDIADFDMKISDIKENNDLRKLKDENVRTRIQVEISELLKKKLFVEREIIDLQPGLTRVAKNLKKKNINSEIASIKKFLKEVALNKEPAEQSYHKFLKTADKKKRIEDRRESPKGRNRKSILGKIRVLETKMKGMASGAFKNDYLIAKLELEAKLASSWTIYKNVQKEISKLKAKMTRANQMQTKESSRKVKVVTIEDVIKSIQNYEKAINVLIDKKRTCSRLEAKRIELDIKKKKTQLYKLNKKLGERQT